MTDILDSFDARRLIPDDRQFAVLTWRRLTEPERQQLLSCAAGFPMVPHYEVKRRLVALGLITDDLAVTDNGRTVVRCR